MKAPYLHIAVLTAFLAYALGPDPLAQAQDFRLPAPGVMVHLSPPFNPPVFKGIKVHTDDPFRFDFILDQGDSVLSQEQLKDQSSKLIKYFLAGLTVPEKDLWVNLSPYEKDRIVPESFGQTEMGRDLLAEDYMLKQITASLIYPEGKIGRRFWKKVYEQAARRYGTTNIPVNTFNKVWIVPQKAVVYENAKAATAYVVKSRLKVMLEQDYLALAHNAIPVQEGSRNKSDINALGSQIVREVVIPELTKEVNEDKNFSQLRQIYNSLILATWYKKKIKDSILARVYENKNKIAGVNIHDPREKQKIYERYLQAFKKGAYNYIKEDLDPVTRQALPRKYFSGGEDFSMVATQKLLEISGDAAMEEGIVENPRDVIVSAGIKDAAMSGRVESAQSLGDRKKQEDVILINQDYKLEDNISLEHNPDLGGILNKNGHLMAVFDGHSRSGGSGAEIAQEVKDKLPGIFGQQLLNYHGDVERAFNGTFRRLSSLTRNYTSGTTATVVYVPEGSNKIYYAVLGDSPFFIIKKDGSFELAPMHTLENFHNNPEVKRIQKYFERNEGSIEQTGIYAPNDMGQEKSSKVPRALGSSELGRAVSKDPEIGVMETELRDAQTLGLGSDGILKGTPESSRQSIKDIVDQIKSGMSPEEIVNDAENPNDDNRTLALWHPADKAMTIAQKNLRRKTILADMLRTLKQKDRPLMYNTVKGFLNFLNGTVAKSSFSEAEPDRVITRQAFSDAHLDADLIWAELRKDGYIDSRGTIKKAKFRELPGSLAYQLRLQINRILKSAPTMGEIKLKALMTKGVLVEVSSPGAQKQKTLVRLNPKLGDVPRPPEIGNPDYDRIWHTLQPTGDSLLRVLKGIAARHYDAVYSSADAVQKRRAQRDKEGVMDRLIRHINYQFGSEYSLYLPDSIPRTQAPGQSPATPPATSTAASTVTQPVQSSLFKEEELPAKSQPKPRAQARARSRVNKAGESPGPDLFGAGDRAMKVANPKGGIDLNTSRMDLQLKNNNGEITFHLDPAMLERLQNAPGFVPVIINIQPMSSLKSFLGLADGS